LITTKTENLASKQTIGVTENLITGSGIALDLEPNCGELKKLLMRTESSETGKSWPTESDSGACITAGFTWENDTCWYSDSLDGAGICTSDATKMIIAWGPLGDITWEANQIDVTQIKTEFKVNAIGTYNFTSQVLIS